jgi:hypothetical protein
MEDTFQTYEEVVKFLKWLQYVGGQVYYVDWTTYTVRYNRTFIKELDMEKSMLHYYMGSNGKTNGEEDVKSK